MPTKTKNVISLDKLEAVTDVLIEKAEETAKWTETSVAPENLLLIAAARISLKKREQYKLPSKLEKSMRMTCLIDKPSWTDPELDKKAN